MEELLKNDVLFNKVYQRLFTTFLSGITKRHKREYFSFELGNGKKITGRAILPSEIVLNEKEQKEVEERAFQIFRLEYEETKYYPNHLIKTMFGEMYEDIYQIILQENLLTVREQIIDELVDEVLKSKLK